MLNTAPFMPLIFPVKLFVATLTGRLVAAEINAQLVTEVFGMQQR